MLRIVDRRLGANAHTTLESLQALIDAEPDYVAMVEAAKPISALARAKVSTLPLISPQWSHIDASQRKL